MQLGDKKLIVQLASIGAKTMAAATAAPVTNAPVTVQVPGLNFSSVNATPTTEVLCLLNMVTEDELIDDDEYEGNENTIILIKKYVSNQTIHKYMKIFNN